MRWQVNGRANRLSHKKSRGRHAANVLVILGLAGPLASCASGGSDEHQGLLENCLSDIACLEFAATTSPLWLPLIEETDGSSEETNDDKANADPQRFRSPGIVHIASCTRKDCCDRHMPCTTSG